MKSTEDDCCWRITVRSKRIFCCLVVTGMVLLSVGCKATEQPPASSASESASSVQSVPTTPEPPPEPVWVKPVIVQPQSKLQNAAVSGLLPSGASLDMPLGRYPDKGAVVYNTMFPAAWPLAWTIEYIPQYPGSGCMMLTRICSTDKDDPAAAVSLGVNVYNYQAEELNSYYPLLLEAGYTETIDPPTEQDMKYMPSPNVLFRKFVRQDASVLIITGSDKNGNYFNLVLTMTDKLEPQVAAWEKVQAERIARSGTALLNATEAGMLPDGEAMDTLMDTRNSDVPGVITHVTQFPTAWPTEEVAGYLPLYPGEGWMGQTIVSSPDHTVPTAAHSVTVVIYHYDPQQLVDYFLALLNAGFVSSDDFRELEGKLPPGSSLSHKATKEGVSIYITQSTDNYGPYVDINVFMEERLLAWVVTQKDTPMRDQLLQWAEAELAAEAK